MVLMWGREGAEALLNALLVADIRVDALKHRQCGAWGCRDMQARLGHEAEQAHRFQGDRLAPRIRPGDDQNMEILTQPNVNGHHVPGE